MSFTFRPAKREAVGLLIGMVGPSGGGKTFSAMRLATGMSSGKRFCCIDTEASRALHYADQFAFDEGDLTAPFSPTHYAEAIETADRAGYPVIVVDSFSHEHAGEGGLLDMQEAEFQRMGAREAVKMASWIKPKMAHKAMVQRLLQVRAHLILCFRAEQKIEMVKDHDGKMQVVPKRTLSGFSEWIPVAEKTLLYEFTASFLLTPDTPGKPKPIKLQEQMRAFFPLDQPISEESGRRLAEWASGGTPRRTLTPETQAAMRSPEAQRAQQEANRKVAAAETSGDPRPRMANGEPIEIVDRAVLIGKIKGVSSKLGLSKVERDKLSLEHLGTAGADMNKVDISALDTLLQALRAKEAQQTTL